MLSMVGTGVGSKVGTGEGSGVGFSVGTGGSPLIREYPA